jgi:dipeptidase E
MNPLRRSNTLTQQTQERRLLLISNSTLHGSGYLDHAEQEIRAALDAIKRVLFVPFALYDRDEYAAQARNRFEAMGYALDSIHEAKDAKRAAAMVDNTEAIFIGGGNTFRLLDNLYSLDLLDAIRRRVAEGMLYMGSSAGAVVAAPTIRTTNDMPIVQPPSFNSLPITRIQIPTQLTWVKRGRCDSSSFWKTTRHPWWDYGKDA